jgi:hypothetical protein
LSALWYRKVALAQAYTKAGALARHFKNRRCETLRDSLECAALSALWYRKVALAQAYTKAATRRRTPKGVPHSKGGAAKESRRCEGFNRVSKTKMPRPWHRGICGFC